MRRPAVPPPTLAGRAHLVLPVRIDPSGERGPTPAEVRGPYWRRTSRGLYVPQDGAPTTEQRILEAAATLPPHGAVTGWSAMHWTGCRQWFTGVGGDGTTPLPVDLAIGGEKARHQHGLQHSAERLDPRDVIVVDALRVTSAVRSTCFQMRYARGVRAAAQVLSMSAYHDAVSIEEMRTYADEHSGWTGIPQCRKAIEIAEENCWSPREVDLVHVWRLDAGLPRPMCNRPVFDRAGRLIGTPDLLDEEAGVVAEYDGAVHLLGAQRTRDIAREERFRGVGLEYLTVLASHLTATAQLVERIHAVRARSAFAAAADRPWTVEPPSWWVPTHTVALRRGLTAAQRARALRYRRAA